MGRPWVTSAAALRASEHSELAAKFLGDRIDDVLHPDRIGCKVERLRSATPLFDHFGRGLGDIADIYHTFLFSPVPTQKNRRLSIARISRAKFPLLPSPMIGAGRKMVKATAAGSHIAAGSPFPVEFTLGIGVKWVAFVILGDLDAGRPRPYTRVELKRTKCFDADLRREGCDILDALHIDPLKFLGGDSAKTMSDAGGVNDGIHVFLVGKHVNG